MADKNEKRSWVMINRAPVLTLWAAVKNFRKSFRGKAFGSGLQYRNFGARGYGSFIMKFYSSLPLVAG